MGVVTWWYYFNILLSLWNGFLAMFSPLAFLSMWGHSWPLTPALQGTLIWYGHANFVLAGFQFFVVTLEPKNQARAALINLLFAPLTIYSCLAAETHSGLWFAFADYGSLALFLYVLK